MRARRGERAPPYCLMLVRLGLASLLACAALARADWDPPAHDPAHLDMTRLKAMEEEAAAGKFRKIGSVLVARHGKLVYEKYFDGDASTLRNTRSATKSITDILVGLAIEDGKLSGVSARVLELLPERRRKMANRDPRKDRITVEDLLTMSSALECDDWNDASRGNEERMYLIEDWAQFILDLPIGGRMHIGEAKETLPYGRRFSYCTGGAFVLGEIVGKVTGERADRYAQRRLFGPMGIRAENVRWTYSPLDGPQTGGGLELRSRDLLAIGQMWLDGGRWNGRQIVNEAWVKASVTPHARISENTDYGYFWWLQSFKSANDGVAHPAFFMTGNGGNRVYGFPDLDAAVVVTSTNYNSRDMHQISERVLTEFVLPALFPER
ncbi:MAG: serine hydrolase domain-containing protein [Bacillota bacterium]